MALFRGSKKKQETLTKLETPPTAATTSREPRLERVNWLGLKVADVLGEALFFEEKLHLKAREEGNSAAGHHVLYDCQGLFLELIEGGQTWATRPKPRRGNPEVPLVASFVVDHVEQLNRELLDEEVLTTQIYDQGWVANFLFFDAERNLWQVSETRNEPAVGLDQLKRIGAIWLGVEDLPAQVAFYRDVLGLPLSDLDNRARPVTEAAEQPDAEITVGANNETVAEFEIDPTEPLPQPVYAVDNANQQIRDGATFFDSGTRLVLTSGGHRLEGGGEKQWGIDTPFMIGFQTNNLGGLAEKLRQHQVKVQGPFRYAHHLGLTRQQQAIRFTDPEGNVWQVVE